MACHHAVKETFHRDKVRIAHKKYAFLEDSEDFQFSAPLKCENDQVEKINLDQNIKLLFSFWLKK